MGSYAIVSSLAVLSSGRLLEAVTKRDEKENE